MAEIADLRYSPSGGRLRSRAAQAPVAIPPAHPLPAGYVHLGVAREIAPTLRAFGLDPDPIIKAAGLDPRVFDDSASLIPYRALGRLCALSVARTRCRHFGLLVGRRATILSLGLVGRLMLHSETFGDALRGLVANLSVQDRVVVPSLDVEGDTAVFSYAVYQPETESADQITDGAIACAVNAIRALLGEDWAPTEVLLPRAQPADTEPYRRHFRAPVRFDQEIAALVFPSRCLELRIAGADPLLRAMLEERIKQLKGAQGSEFPDDIRRLLRMRLTSNRCSADDIADLLAIHRRTLSRRLKGGGMGYRDISNEIRFEIARQLLGDTDCRSARSRRPSTIRRRAPLRGLSGAGPARPRTPGGRSTAATGSRAHTSRNAAHLKNATTRGDTSMKSRPIAADRANAAIELRYNLFRHKWRPDLCCAVPEHHPVPSFITGDQWDYGGTRDGAISPPGWNLTAVDAGMCLDSSHLFQLANSCEGPRMSGVSAACGLGEPLRRLRRPDNKYRSARHPCVQRSRRHCRTSTRVRMVHLLSGAGLELQPFTEPAVMPCTMKRCAMK